SLAGAMMPLGLIAAGPLSDMISIQIWYLVGAVVTAGFGIGGFFSKALMSLEETSQAMSH
ncbi:MAG: hypothetical protein ACK2TZ_07765, partial [Anaerolineales bacterium]